MLEIRYSVVCAPPGESEFTETKYDQKVTEYDGKSDVP